MARSLAAFALFCAALLPLPGHALDHTQVAVIMNTLDPLSVEIAEYYASRRAIPIQNVIRVGFPHGRSTLTAGEFAALNAWVLEKTPPGIEAYVLTWAAPYRVECMSITSAFAFGFDAAFCADTCRPTRRSPYFNSSSRLPFSDLGIRPAMSIAATTFAQAKALIDRGVDADGTAPDGTVYLLSTSDAARNVRSNSYPMVENMLKGHVRVNVLKQDALKNAQDVLFYFTGVSAVRELDTLKFVRGAIADHLTSGGGNLTDSSQMSALRWLEAGTTASYGAVVEPCNMPQKFPTPPVVIARYLQGETLIEAYWKSVLMPGQGIFIGEPLAAPFVRKKTQ